MRTTTDEAAAPRNAGIPGARLIDELPRRIERVPRLGICEMDALVHRRPHAGHPLCCFRCHGPLVMPLLFRGAAYCGECYTLETLGR